MSRGREGDKDVGRRWALFLQTFLEGKEDMVGLIDRPDHEHVLRMRKKT